MKFLNLSIGLLFSSLVFSCATTNDILEECPGSVNVEYLNAKLRAEINPKFLEFFEKTLSEDEYDDFLDQINSLPDEEYDILVDAINALVIMFDDLQKATTEEEVEELVVKLKEILKSIADKLNLEISAS